MEVSALVCNHDTKPFPVLHQKTSTGNSELFKYAVIFPVELQPGSVALNPLFAINVQSSAIVRHRHPLIDILFDIKRLRLLMQPGVRLPQILLVTPLDANTRCAV